jgi:hypothetical protein
MKPITLLLLVLSLLLSNMALSDNLKKKEASKAYTPKILKLTAEEIFQYVEQANANRSINRKESIEMLQLALDGKLLLGEQSPALRIRSHCFFYSGCGAYSCASCARASGQNCACSLCCVAKETSKSDSQ